MAKDFSVSALLKVIANTNPAEISIGNLRKTVEDKPISISVSVRGNAAAEIAALKNGFSGVAAEATKASAAASRSATAMVKEYKSVSAAIDEASTATERFGQQVGLSARRFAAFTAATAGFFVFTRGLRDGLSDLVAFDTALNKLEQISDESRSSVVALANSTLDLAKNLGVSGRELMDVSLIFKQAGLSIIDTQKAISAVASTALAPNFDNMKQTAEGAIAAFQQFGKSADNIRNQLGAMNAVAGGFAVEASDLVTATQRAGGAFSALGGDLNELMGLFTSVRATTRESAESIATGMRTIFARLQRSDTVDALKNMGINLRYTADEVKSLKSSGIDVIQDQFVGAFEAVKRLSSGISELNAADPRFSAIIEQLGGYRQISRVIPLIKEYGEAQKAVNAARLGGVSLDISDEVAKKRLETRLGRVREEYSKLFTEMGQTASFQKVADALETVAHSFTNVISAAAPLLPFLTGRLLGGVASGLAQFSSGVAHPGLYSANTARMTQVPMTPIKRRNGGMVPGGYGGGDSVPALLEPGESVLTKEASARIGHATIEKWNRSGGSIPKHAKGTASQGEAVPFRKLDIDPATGLTPEAFQEMIQQFEQNLEALAGKGKVKPKFNKLPLSISAGLDDFGTSEKRLTPDELAQRNGVGFSARKDDDYVVGLQAGRIPKKKGASRAYFAGDSGTNKDLIRGILAHELGHVIADVGVDDKTGQPHPAVQELLGSKHLPVVYQRVFGEKIKGMNKEQQEYRTRPVEMVADLFRHAMTTGPEGMDQLKGIKTQMAEVVRTAFSSRAAVTNNTANPQKTIAEAMGLASRDSGWEVTGDAAKPQVHFGAPGIKGFFAGGEGSPYQNIIKNAGITLSMDKETHHLTRDQGELTSHVQTAMLAALSQPVGSLYQKTATGKDSQYQQKLNAAVNSGNHEEATRIISAYLGGTAIPASIRSEHSLDRIRNDDGIMTTALHKIHKPERGPGSDGDTARSLGTLESPVIAARGREETTQHFSTVDERLDFELAQKKTQEKQAALEAKAAASAQLVAETAMSGNKGLVQSDGPVSPVVARMRAMQAKREAAAAAAAAAAPPPPPLPPAPPAPPPPPPPPEKGSNRNPDSNPYRSRVEVMFPKRDRAPTSFEIDSRRTGVPFADAGTTPYQLSRQNIWAMNNRAAMPQRADVLKEQPLGYMQSLERRNGIGSTSLMQKKPWQSGYTAIEHGGVVDINGTRDMAVDGSVTRLPGATRNTYDKSLEALQRILRRPQDSADDKRIVDSVQKTVTIAKQAGVEALQNWGAAVAVGVKKFQDYGNIRPPFSGVVGGKPPTTPSGIPTAPSSESPGLSGIGILDYANRVGGNSLLPIGGSTLASVQTAAEAKVDPTTGSLKGGTAALAAVHSEERRLRAAVQQQLRDIGFTRGEARLTSSELTKAAVATNSEFLSDVRGRPSGLPIDVIRNLGRSDIADVMANGQGRRPGLIGRVTDSVGNSFGKIGRGLNDWNQSMQNTGLGRFAGDPMRVGAASYVASAIGQNMAYSNDSLKAAVISGDTGMAKTGEVSGGVLSGAAMGAGFGAATGTAPGVIIGATIGALYGLVTSLRAASQRIREVAADLAVTKLNETFSAVASGRQRYEEINPAEFAKAVDTTRRTAREAAVSSRSYLFGTIEGYDQYATNDAYKSQIRQTGGSQLNALYAGVVGQAERIGVNNSGNVSSDSGRTSLKSRVEEQLGQNPVVGKSIELLLDLGVWKSTAHALRELGETAEKAAISEKSRLDTVKAATANERKTNSFGRLADAALAASQASDFGVIQNQNILARGIGGAPAPLSDVSHLLRGIGANSPEDSRKLFGMLGSIPGGSNSAATLEAADKVARELPEIIDQVLKGSKLGTNNDTESLQKALDSKFQNQDPETKRAIQTVISELGGVISKNEGSLGKALKEVGDTPTFAKSLLNPLTHPAIETGGRLIQSYQEMSGRQNAGYSTVRGFEEASLQNLAGAAEARLSARRVGLEADSARTGYSAISRLSVGDLRSPTDTMLNGLTAGGGKSVEAISERLRLLDAASSKLAASREDVRSDPKKLEAIQTEYQKVIGESQRLTKALALLADGAKMAAAAQEKKASVDSSINARRSYAERVLFASPEERSRMYRQAADAKAVADNLGSFKNMSEFQQKSAISGLNDMGDVRFPNGMLPSEVKKNALDSLLPGGAHAKELSESADLAKQIKAAFEEDARAKEELAKRASADGRSFLENLEKSFAKFLAEMGKSAIRDEIRTAEAEKHSIVQEGSRLDKDSERVQILSKLGITSDVQLRKAAASAPAITEFAGVIEQYEKLHQMRSIQVTPDKVNEFIKGKNLAEHPRNEDIQDFLRSSGIEPSSFQDDVGQKLLNQTRSALYFNRNGKFGQILPKDNETAAKKFNNALAEAIDAQKIHVDRAQEAALGKTMWAGDEKSRVALWDQIKTPEGLKKLIDSLNSFNGDRSLEGHTKRVEDNKNAFEKLTERLTALNLQLNERNPGAAGALGGASAIFDTSPKGTDTKPAMLTPGEAVIPADTVKKNAPLVSALIDGKATEYFADGGIVGGAVGGFGAAVDDQKARILAKMKRNVARAMPGGNVDLLMNGGVKGMINQEQRAFGLAGIASDAANGDDTGRWGLTASALNASRLSTPRSEKLQEAFKDMQAARREAFAKSPEAARIRKAVSAPFRALGDQRVAQPQTAPKFFADGGFVPGNGNTDSVNARLTPGEFVISRKMMTSASSGGAPANVDAGKVVLAVADFAKKTDGMLGGFATFGKSVDRLVAVLEKFPSTISMEATVQHEHTFNGLEAFEQMREQFKGLAEEVANATIDSRVPGANSKGFSE